LIDGTSLTFAFIESQCGAARKYRLQFRWKWNYF